MTDPTNQMILKVAQGLKPENYEFTVAVGGLPYDVYWFEERGIVGQLAYAKIAGKWEIAMFRAGRHTEQEVTEYMQGTVLQDMEVSNVTQH